MRARISDWWERRSESEQRALRLLSVVAALAILAQFLILPLQQAADRNRERIADEQQRLLRMRSQASEIVELARRPAPAKTTDLRERVLSAFSRLAPASAPLIVEPASAGEVRVRLTEVSFDALIGALEPVLRDTRARVSEFSAIALAEPGMVRAELAIRR